LIENTRVPIKVLALSFKQHRHYAPLYEEEGLEIIETDDAEPERLGELHVDLVLTLSNDFWRSGRLVRAANERRIPALYMLDGVLEWRHQWLNPRFGAGGKAPFGQLITADKVACLGWRSARVLESWGAVGKCEVVGIPRLDHYIDEPVQHKVHEGPKRLLVMTANTPGFTPSQVAAVKGALRDVKEALSDAPGWNPIWRVRGGIDKELDLNDRYPDLQGLPLRDVFAEADAVLTTPSTVVLESMLAGLPTAILDYSNSPPYLTAAWMVTAPMHIPSVLEELSEPTARRLLYQYGVLHDNLACFTPATPRLAHLIRSMAAEGRRARQAGRAPKHPARIVPPEHGGLLFPPEDLNYAKLYPGHPVFAKRDLWELQLELTQARREIEYLRDRLKARGPGYWFARGMTHLYQKIRRS